MSDEVVTNAQGGSQSRLDFDFTQLDADMLMRVARVLNTGAQKYGEKNWQKIPTHDHINHMIYHAIMANTKDTSEDHLANTICRAMFAMWTQTNDYEEFPGLGKLLEPLPVGFMPGSKMGYVTEPFQPNWCMQCPHDAKAHIITPNIEGDCLVCAKCGCCLQLAEADKWCEHCKHPMANHKVVDWYRKRDRQDLDGNEIDSGIETQMLTCADCGCNTYRDVDKNPPHLSEVLGLVTPDKDPPILSKNICKCGHHAIAHHSIGTYLHPSRGSCKSPECHCFKFDSATELVADQDIE